MNYINIIEQTPIQVVPGHVLGILFAVLVAIIIIPTVVAWIIVKHGSRDWIKIVYTELIAGVTSIICCILFMTCIDNYFMVDTNRYKYKVTIDRSKITVQEYEDFYIKYKPEIKDGFYYFESEDILEANK